MMPATIIARPEDDGFARRSDPEILTLPRIAPGPAAASPARPANRDEFSIRDVLNALRYHSILFLTLGTLVSGGLAVLVWNVVPAKYTTSAMILVSQSDPKMLGGADTGKAEFAIYLTTQAKMIKSSHIILGALRDPEVARMPMLAREEDPISFLEEKILTEFTDTSQLLKVMLSGEDPVEITKIVNAVVSFYMKETERERDSKAQKILQLGSKRQKAETNLKEKFRKSETDNLIGGNSPNESVAVKQKLRMSEYLAMQQDRLQVQRALTVFRAELSRAQTALKNQEASPVAAPDLGERIDNDPSIANKKAAIAGLESAISRHRRFSSNPDGYPYPDLKRKLDAAVADLEALRQKVRAAVDNDFRQTFRVKVNGEIDQAQREISRNEEIERDYVNKLKTEFKDLDTPDEIKKPLTDTTMAQDDITRLRAELDKLDRGMMQLQLDLDAPDRVYLYQKAEVPQKREIKKQIALSGVAGLFGLGLVGGLITLGEVRRKRVYGPKDALFTQQLPLLGCIPEHGAPPAGADVTRLDGLDPASQAFFEALDKVKTVICRQMQRRRMQAILVTSASPDEGKSILAWNLALSLARTDKRTLFIDGNLRNPGLHNHFDIASHPGLSELLRGEKTMQEVAQRTALDNLWCIAAGVCDEVARHSLDKDRLRLVLERARHDFDVIVIDSCSIREAVDPLYIAQRVDASVLSVRTFRSRTTEVERAVHRLGQLGTPLLGAVLTDASGAAAVEL